MDDRVGPARFGLLCPGPGGGLRPGRGQDRLVLLGDLLYHGPRNDLPREYAPKEVIPLLNGLGDRLLCVRGNCDSEVDQMVLTFPHPGRLRRFWPWGSGWSTAPTAMCGTGRTCRPSGRGISSSTATPMCPPGPPFWGGEPLPQPGLPGHPQGGQPPQLHDHPGQPDPVEDPGRGHLPRPGPVTTNPPLIRNHFPCQGRVFAWRVGKKARWQDVPPPAGSRGFWVIGRSAPAGGPGG